MPVFCVNKDLLEHTHTHACTWKENRQLDVANRSKNCWTIKVFTLTYEFTRLIVFDSIHQELCPCVRDFILWWKILEKCYTAVPFGRQLLTSTSPGPAKPVSIPCTLPTHSFPISTLRITRINKFLDMHTLLKVGWIQHFSRQIKTNKQNRRQTIGI